MTRSHSDLARAAIAYASRGLSVFPLADGAKVPARGSHGHLDATADPEAVACAWQAAPAANIGLVTGPASGLWVLDVDPRHGGDQALAALEAAHAPLPATIEASTPSGGRHLYFRWPLDGPEIRNSAGKVGAGLDVRGAGGFITAPPSRLADGRRYRWTRTGSAGLAQAPAWLLRLAAPPPPPKRPVHHTAAPPDCARYVAAAVADELRGLEGASDGCRNSTLNRASFALAGFVATGALPEDWARDQLETRALATGLSAIEARRTIDSAFTAAPARELPR